MTAVKVCTACEVEKLLSNFSSRRRRSGNVTYQSWCRPCQKLYKDEHYRQNKGAYMMKAKERNRVLEAEVRAMKEASPCIDCGLGYPHYVMDHDHRDPSSKSMNVANMVHRSYGRKKVMEEIAKCDLVCSNCHRERTHGPNAARSSMG